MEFLGNFEFGQSRLIPYLPIVVLAVFAISMVWMQRRRKMLTYIGKSRGRIHGHWRICSYLLLVWTFAGGLMLILAEPYSKTVIGHDLYEPIDIVFTVDISKSMLAQPTGSGVETVTDCAPTRLREVERQVLNFISRVENEKYITARMALVVFARHAYPVIPLFTDDLQFFKRRFQQELSIRNIINVPEGSNHWYALERSLAMFQEDASHKKILVMLTDGEPAMPPEALLLNKRKAMKALRENKEIDIHVIGIGQPNVRTPIYAVWSIDGCPDKNSDFLRQVEGERQGEIMWTIADLGKLRDFALETGGRYIHSATGRELAESLQEIISLKRRRIGVDHETRRYDLSRPIIIGLLIVLAGMVLCKTP